ncbi:TetR/AcrR family transcriptional regulator [Bradyrhizobium sp. HKCCYLS1011]|uniref:TetR/AcrR family transcriptional regulator n=1 Tax=Bradyrhizobium sp. HKCCYLS1011 TaxID=3420733 RepID=UPI003EC0F167
MSSQKTRAIPPATQPTRQRGHLRVAVILDAATALFAERDYDAVTMTEIAARSSTAIGSLYRFFPTKELLADALLARYGERLDHDLSELADRASTLSAAELAGGIFDAMLARADDRAAAVNLVEARSNTGAQRARIRALMLDRLGAVVGAANPDLAPAEIELRAKMLLGLVKVIAVNAEWADAAVLDETRRLIELYLAARIMRS